MNRCKICWLPSEMPVCSHRCRRLGPKKRHLYANRPELEDAVLAAVRAFSPNTTECPGNLAERLTCERAVNLTARDALACLREIYFALRSHRKIRFFQKGVVIPLGKDDFRGPFHLGK